MKTTVPTRSPTRVSPARVVVVGLGLAVTGALVGAASSFVAASLLGIAAGRGLSDATVPMVAALFGAALGAILGPVAGFSVLRQVPIGRAIGWTALGAVAGGLLGAPLPFGLLLGPIVGFGIAALALYASVRRSRRARAPF